MEGHAMKQAVRWFFLWALLAVLLPPLGLSGCNKNATGVVPCKTRNDCQLGQICDRRFCRDAILDGGACGLDDHCPVGMYCDVGALWAGCGDMLPAEGAAELNDADRDALSTILRKAASTTLEEADLMGLLDQVMRVRAQQGGRFCTCQQFAALVIANAPSGVFTTTRICNYAYVQPQGGCRLNSQQPTEREGDADTTETAEQDTGDQVDQPDTTGEEDPPDELETAEADAEKEPEQAPFPCEDGNPCTDSYWHGTGCAHDILPDDTDCDDQDSATTDDRCHGGICYGDGRDSVGCCGRECLDCTTNMISHASAICRGGVCGYKCYLGYRLVAGVCVEFLCDDGDPCTFDTYTDDGESCLFAPIEDELPCLGGTDKCLTGGTCRGGVCEGAGPLTCADENPCTDDSCEPNTGCVFARRPDWSGCDDDDPCTAPGYCQRGVCQLEPKDCADEIPCTMDACTPTTGVCTHAPDNSLCGSGQTCSPETGCQ